MAKEFGLFYREGTADYVLNLRGKLYYDPKTCQTFKQLKDVTAYLRKTSGDRISILRVEPFLDLEGALDQERELDKKRKSELEQNLRGTRIQIEWD
ncbi:MAG TPA: hypothetical protein VJA23_06725 [Candidatus Nanoarchaeia archaeon]|nr:hypothetical protein [Candidatus Nanoarchaeia archaeon]